MITYDNCDKNENGSALIVVLIVLAFLAVIAGMASETSLFEVTLAGVDKQSNQLRINSESAAMAGVQQLENLIYSTDEADREKLSNIDWESITRLDWLHKGQNNCVESSGNYNEGDLNLDGKTNDEDGTDKVGRARAYSRAYFMDDDTDESDNWILTPATGSLRSCSRLRDSANNSIPTMENAKYMVIDCGISGSDSLGVSLTPTSKRKDYLVSGVDERTNGMHMIQVGYSNRVAVSDSK